MIGGKVYQKAMNNQEFLKFKKSQLVTLDAIKSFLLKGYSKDITPLDSIKNELQSLTKDSMEMKCCIANLVLDIPKEIRRINGGLKLFVNLSYTVDLRDKCKKFIFKDYSCNLKLSSDNGLKSVCWHIDKDAGVGSNEFHPLYHLQMAPCCKCADMGNCSFLALDSPRLPFPPLDLVLCIGFCLTNFYVKGSFENNFTSNQQVMKAYRKSQKEILKRYYGILASDDAKSIKVLNPMMV